MRTTRSHAWSGNASRSRYLNAGGEDINSRRLRPNRPPDSPASAAIVEERPVPTLRSPEERRPRSLLPEFLAKPEDAGETRKGRMARRARGSFDSPHRAGR